MHQHDVDDRECPEVVHRAQEGPFLVWHCKIVEKGPGVVNRQHVSKDFLSVFRVWRFQF